MLAAEGQNGECDWNANEGADYAPQEGPKEDGEQHEKRGNRQYPSRDAWLDITAYSELDDVKADKGTKNGLPASKMSHRQQCRE